MRRAYFLLFSSVLRKDSRSGSRKKRANEEGGSARFLFSPSTREVGAGGREQTKERGARDSRTRRKRETKNDLFSAYISHRYSPKYISAQGRESGDKESLRGVTKLADVIFFLFEAQGSLV